MGGRLGLLVSLDKPKSVLPWHRETQLCLRCSLFPKRSLCFPSGHPGTGETKALVATHKSNVLLSLEVLSPLSLGFQDLPLTTLSLCAQAGWYPEGSASG